MVGWRGCHVVLSYNYQQQPTQWTQEYSRYFSKYVSQSSWNELNQLLKVSTAMPLVDQNPQFEWYILHALSISRLTLSLSSVLALCWCTWLASWTFHFDLTCRIACAWCSPWLARIPSPLSDCINKQNPKRQLAMPGLLSSSLLLSSQSHPCLPAPRLRKQGPSPAGPLSWPYLPLSCQTDTTVQQQQPQNRWPISDTRHLRGQI